MSCSCDAVTLRSASRIWPILRLYTGLVVDACNIVRSLLGLTKLSNTLFLIGFGWDFDRGQRSKNLGGGKGSVSSRYDLVWTRSATSDSVFTHVGSLADRIALRWISTSLELLAAASRIVARKRIKCRLFTQQLTKKILRTTPGVARGVRDEPPGSANVPGHSSNLLSRRQWPAALGEEAQFGECRSDRRPPRGSKGRRPTRTPRSEPNKAAASS